MSFNHKEKCPFGFGDGGWLEDPDSLLAEEEAGERSVLNDLIDHTTEHEDVQDQIDDPLQEL